ncbi:hypothetical protein GCM10022288_01390 [Gryllotalpicola kribbensis]|uniref:Helix-turn-helix domain-containing protein n=1 Tax=Gryllotalpicola kribbensis TaxID=993084 RepID=A0ABP8AEY0_9MICO
MHPLRNYSNRKRATNENRALLADAQGSSRSAGESGTKQRQVQKRLGETAVASLIQLYREGETTYDLARRFEVHRSTVVRHLEKAGIRRRGDHQPERHC